MTGLPGWNKIAFSMEEERPFDSFYGTAHICPSSGDAIFLA